MALLETLQDNYDDGVRAAAWNVGAALMSGNVATAVTVTETGGLLQVAAANATAGTNYSGYTTALATWDLTNSAALVQVVATTANTGFAETLINIGTDVNNRFIVLKDSTPMLNIQYVAAGVKTTLYAAPYSATTHRWWRVRHGTALGGLGGDVVYFDTSDGLVWTYRASVARPFAITALIAETIAGTWGSTTGAPGTAQFDNFNLLPAGYVPPPNFPGILGLDARRMY